MDHPGVEQAIRTGYLGGEPEHPRCPVCGRECEEVYKDVNLVIFGCNECVSTRSAWECAECN